MSTKTAQDRQVDDDWGPNRRQLERGAHFVADHPGRMAGLTGGVGALGGATLGGGAGAILGYLLKEREDSTLGALAEGGLIGAGIGGGLGGLGGAGLGYAMSRHTKNDLQGVIDKAISSYDKAAR